MPYRYVEAVIAGRETPDTSVGRQLWDLVQSVPKMDTVEFEKMLNSNLRDLLMVIYLSQLTKVKNRPSFFLVYASLPQYLPSGTE
jgi:translation initiation factor 3 subunit F